MATTTTGWPYDEPGDTVYTYPARTQVLAEALEARLGSGGLRLLGSSSPVAQSSFSIESVFSATYDHYLCEYELTHSASTVGLQRRLRVTATDDTTANYADQYAQGVGGTTGAGQTTGATSARVGFVALTGGWGTFELWHPGTAVPTRGIGTNGIALTAPSVQTHAFGHNVATAYTALTLLVTSGTVTGTVRVYGYVK